MMIFGAGRRVWTSCRARYHLTTDVEAVTVGKVQIETHQVIGVDRDELDR